MTRKYFFPRNWGGEGGGCLLESLFLKVFFSLGCCLNFCFLGVWGLFFFFFFVILTHFFHPPSMQNTPFPRCSGLHSLGNFFGHVKSAHPLANFVSQASQVVFFASVFLSCDFPWFYSFCFLGLVSSII